MGCRRSRLVLVLRVGRLGRVRLEEGEEEVPVDCLLGGFEGGGMSCGD